jgi:hypothetical protein
MGNVLFLAGVTLTIGPKRTLKFFIRPRNHKGTACFLGGLTLVFVVGRCRSTYQLHVETARIYRLEVSFDGLPLNFAFKFNLRHYTVGWPFIGMCVEGYGFLILFSAFFPTVGRRISALVLVETRICTHGIKTWRWDAWGETGQG